MRKLIPLAAGFATALCVANTAVAQTTTLKFITLVPGTDRSVTEVIQPWMRAVERDSGGTIKFQGFFGGQLVQSLAKEFEAVMSGVADTGYIISSITYSLFPDMELLSMPLLVNSSAEGTHVAWRLYEKGLMRGLENVYLAAIFTNDPNGIHLTKKINSIAELAGVKIRVSGPGQSAVVQALGGVPIGGPVPQSAESLSRGLYQGTLAGWAANATFRLGPLLKSNIDLPFGVQAIFVPINKKVYDALPPQGREAINKNSGLALSQKFSQTLEITGSGDRAEAKANGKLVTVSAGDRAAIEAKMKPIVEKWIADNPDGAKKWAVAQEALAELRKPR